MNNYHQENDICNNNYYLDEDNYCKKKCSGIECNYTCPSNECLVCVDDILFFFNECDNYDICTSEGCLNCITNDECIICTQGYYLLSGECKKCIDGCSFCSDNETCIYCLSDMS